MKRLPWFLRDLVYLALFVALLVGASYALDAMRIAYASRIIMLMGINITLAVSLNIISGHAGQFSLGHAGFMAVGAYFSAFLTYFYFAPYVEKLGEGSQAYAMQNVLLVVSVLSGGALSAIAGYVVGLPSLRLRGDYLAIVTLGFGEIIRVLILNIDKIGAARGFSGIPNWSNFFWVFFFAGITILISWRLVKSSVGRAFLAVREDQIAAEAMGINTTRYKVKAFMIGSFLAGVAGGLYAHYMMYLNPTMFMFIKSFDVVVMVVLGGLGSISGSVIAAIILTYLPEGLRASKTVIPPVAQWLSMHLPSWMQWAAKFVNLFAERDPRMVIYSILLIVLMRTRPQGLLGRRELWQVMSRRKDSIPTESRDQGDADDRLDRDAGPPVQ